LLVMQDVRLLPPHEQLSLLPNVPLSPRWSMPPMLFVVALVPVLPSSRGESDAPFL